MGLSHGEQVAFNEDFNRVFKVERRSDARDASILEESAELLKEGGECYPFTRENLFEALGQISDGKQKIISTYFCTAHAAEGRADLANHGLYVAIKILAQEYWSGVAQVLAVRNVDARLS